jgi:agmatine deiminase
MPAEWEPQAALWLSWPHNRETWPGHFRSIPAVFASVAAHVSRHQDVRINCSARLQPPARRSCARAGADLTRISFYNHPTDDAWCRDHGPIFIKHDETREVAVTDWVRPAWGGKYRQHRLDNQIPTRIAEKLRARRFEKDMVLEGGSIDVNGRGLLLTSEPCLLGKKRNPQLTRREIEQGLKDYLGVTKVLWLRSGLVGDLTDGHIDNLARFYRADGIVAAVESNPRDPNLRPLRDNLERLKSFRTPAGKRFSIVELPVPEPFGFRGQRVPASYANFLIINGAVLVPQFRQKRRDAAACAILGDCFRDREIIPIDCYYLSWGLGTLHCISQQQPAA